MASSEIARFADVAMFEAEPIDVAAGPRVHLLSMNPDPLGEIASACKMYMGEVVTDLRDITDDERIRFLHQVMKTKLKAPFEFVKFHFLVEGLTRAITHQMVRQRTAAFAQESMRFAVKSGNGVELPVALPPSIGEHSAEASVWRDAINHIEDAYEALIDRGIPAEDARGLLPHNTLTRIHYTTDLRALLDHAGNRLCTQAQFEWRLVFAQIANAIRTAQVRIPGATHNYAVHMREELADLFAPVCYATGKCEFMADFDRHCSIRDRVQDFHRNGIPSSEWTGMEHGQIMPAEWLLNHASARKR